jgi:hypothetical protein
VFIGAPAQRVAPGAYELLPQQASIYNGVADVTHNYELTAASYKKGTLTIAKASLVTVTAKDQYYVYNKLPQGMVGDFGSGDLAGVATVTGLPAGHTLERVFIDGARQTLPTSTPATLTPRNARVYFGGNDVTDRFDVTYVPGTLTVDRKGGDPDPITGEERPLAITAKDQTYTYTGFPQGKFGVFSFNGNKIITTSGGGMLISDDEPLLAQARFLATQARDPAPHYQHSTFGYNYRLSNVLAGIGRGQLALLGERVAARRRNEAFYRQALADISGVSFMPEAPWGKCNRWLTHLQIDPAQTGGITREHIRLALEAANIESRPLWKPLHLQPVFAPYRASAQINGTAELLFANGLSVPSGSALTDDELNRIVGIIRKTLARA